MSARQKDRVLERNPASIEHMRSVYRAPIRASGSSKSRTRAVPRIHTADPRAAFLALRQQVPPGVRDALKPALAIAARARSRCTARSATSSSHAAPCSDISALRRVAGNSRKRELRGRSCSSGMFAEPGARAAAVAGQRVTSSPRSRPIPPKPPPIP